MSAVIHTKDHTTNHGAIRNAPSYSIDSISNIAVPANATEWSGLISAAGLSIAIPSHLWLCQETSGVLADSIGSENLSAFAPVRYSRTLASWDRDAVGFDEGAIGEFYSTNIGNTTTQSCLLLGYIGTWAPIGADRGVMRLGSGTGARDAQRDVTTAAYQVTGAGGQATGVGSSDAGNPVVRPLVLQINRTASQITLYTDQEKIQPAYTAPAGGGSYINIGANAITAADTVCFYLAYWEGADAEISAANLKTLLTTAGWSIAWS